MSSSFVVIAIDAEPANRLKRTGTENIAFNLIKELMKIDGGNAEHQFVLYTRGQLLSDWPVLPSNFKHIKLSWPLPFFWSQLRLGWAVRLEPPDIFFVPSHAIPILAKAKTITIVHDIGFIERPDLYKWYWRIFHKLSLRIVLKKAELIITGTEFVKNSLRKYLGPNKTAIVVVPWGVNVNVFNSKTSEDDLDLLKQFNLVSKGYFLYVGRLEKKKNSENLIKAFKLFKNTVNNIELVLVGTVNDNIDRKGIRVLGYQPDKVISILYRQALALVFPTNYEGFGLTVLEAQASGTPVLLSDLPVLKEVSGAAGLFVDTGKTENLTAAMRKIRQDSALRQFLVEKGLVNANKRGWETSGRRVLELIVKTFDSGYN